MSHPARGAWIEINLNSGVLIMKMSHPARGAWIEMYISMHFCTPRRESHPARGAWIEIDDAGVQRGGRAGVAPRKGCVD